MAPEVQSDACSMPCTGRSDVICGGKGAITVFEREGRSSEHIGCYEDSTIDRAMNMATTSNRLMTPEVLHVSARCQSMSTTCHGEEKQKTSRAILQ